MAAEPVQLPTSGSLAGILDVLETDEDFRALISDEIEVPESDIDPSITVGVPEGLRPALAAGAEACTAGTENSAAAGTGSDAGTSEIGAVTVPFSGLSTRRRRSLRSSSLMQESTGASFGGCGTSVRMSSTGADGSALSFFLPNRISSTGRGRLSPDGFPNHLEATSGRRFNDSGTWGTGRS